MKAIRVHEFGNPEVMRLEEVPDLKAGPGEVVVRTQAIGVNPVGTYIRSGMYAVKPPVPYTWGVDAARSHGAVTEPGAYGKTILMP
jgi:NADPH:quinone reductase